MSEPYVIKASEFDDTKQERQHKNQSLNQWTNAATDLNDIHPDKPIVVRDKKLPRYYAEEEGLFGAPGVFDRTKPGKHWTHDWVATFPTQDAAEAYAAWLNMVEENPTLDEAIAVAKEIQG